MFKTSSFSGFLRFAVFFAAILPALLLGYLILENSVNVPFWDEWGTPATGLILSSEGKLSFDHLISQHNESRKFFPRLLFIGLAYLTGWDIRYQMLITFLLACLISYCVYCLSQITVRGSEYKRLALLLLANLLIFSPAQWENWLWGIQLITFVPIASILGGIIFSYSRLKVQFKTIILIFLCTLSTYSYANGMLSWFIVFPCAIIIAKLAPKREPHAQGWLAFGGVLAAIANLTLYFYNYVKPAHHPGFSESLIHPFQAILFLFAFLGAPLASGQLALAMNIGAVLTVLFGFACFYVLSHWKDRLLLNQALAWLAIGTYSFVSGAIATAGRLGFGLEAAISPRYTTFSLYLTVSLIYLLIIIFDRAVRRHYRSGRKRLVVSGILLFLLASLVSLQPMVYNSGVGSMVRLHRDRLYAKACLSFINVVDERSKTRLLFPDYDLLKDRANKLNQIHFLKPGLVESSNLLVLAGKQQEPPETYGIFDAIAPINDRELAASGWAIFPERKQPADAVILAYEAPMGEVKAFAIASVGSDSPDVAQNLNDPTYHNVRWSKTFSRDKLPKGSLKISAWAFDTETQQTFRLAGNKDISNF